MTGPRSVNSDGRLLSTIVLPAGLVGAAILLSAYLARGNPSSALAPAGFVVVVLAAAAMLPSRWRLGVVIGVLVVAGVDAFPGPELDATFKFGLTRQELVVIALMLILAVDIARHRLWRFFQTPLGCLLLLSSLAGIAWWLFTLLRTSAVPGTVLSHSTNFGEDFLSAMILIPLLAASFQRRETRLVALATVGIISLLPAALFVIGTLGHQTFSAFIHPVKTTAATATTGSNRLYAPAQDLFPAAFALGLTAAVLAPPGVWRRVAGLIAGVNLFAVLAGQTRAEYLGLGVGLVLASLVYLHGPAAAGALRRIGSAVVAIAIVVAVVLLGFPGTPASSTVKHFGSRFSSISSTLSSSNATTSTVAERASEAATLEQALGSQWLSGLGFVSYRDVYNAELPGGSIRNTDVGLLNSVMTMGVIGTAIYYLPIFLVAIRLVWVARRRIDESTWVRYGALMGLISVLAASITLDTFFSGTGVVPVAMVIALAATPLTEATGAPAASQRQLRVREPFQLVSGP